MPGGMKEIIEGSKIVSFFTNFNRRALSYFYNSKTHTFFLRLNMGFKDILLRNLATSMIIKSAKKIYSLFNIKDLGLFIILAVVFNTMAMLFYRKEIDIFSAIGRLAFLLFGLGLLFKRMKR